MMNSIATVFLLEDDADLAHLVKHELEVSGFSTRLFNHSSNILSEARKEMPALFLLDGMAQDGNSLELCKQIRLDIHLARIPVIFLTAKSEESDRILGLELGGDAYLIKPFSPRELVARVKAVLRRCGQPATPAVVNVGDITMDTASAKLTVRGTAVATTATEFRLLEYLARHPGRIFSRDNLLDAVWRDTAFVTPRVVDVYVRRLREKIEYDPERPEYIRTMRGAGYRFELPKSSGRENR